MQDQQPRVRIVSQGLGNQPASRAERPLAEPLKDVKYRRALLPVVQLAQHFAAAGSHAVAACDRKIQIDNAAFSWNLTADGKTRVEHTLLTAGKHARQVLAKPGGFIQQLHPWQSRI